MKIFYFETKTLISNYENLKNLSKMKNSPFLCWHSLDPPNRPRAKSPLPGQIRILKNHRRVLRTMLDRDSHDLLRQQNEIFFGVQKSKNAEVFGCFSGFSNFSNFRWFWVDFLPTPCSKSIWRGISSLVKFFTPKIRFEFPACARTAGIHWNFY